MKNIQPEAEKKLIFLSTKSVLSYFVTRAVLPGNELHFCGALYRWINIEEIELLNWAVRQIRPMIGKAISLSPNRMYLTKKTSVTSI